MSKISILVPCYNEEENVVPMTEELTQIFEQQLPAYDYEIIFIDNCSTDQTRPLLRETCEKDRHVKAIFNAKNFGQFRSPYYGLMQTTGDCTVFLCCDFQEPPELIPSMVKEWENGNKLVVMQKTSSEENKLMYFFLFCYYKIIRKVSDVEQIEHFTGFGLYDRSFIEVMRNLNDPTPFLRGVVAELGFKMTFIPYQQRQRRAGKTHNNFYTLYDAAMLSFTSYTKIGLRIATFLGIGIAGFSLLIALVYFILKLIYWDTFVAGTAPILIGMFFLGAVQLVFLGLIGEYILSMNQRIMNRPLVVEEERLNFDEDQADGSK